MSGVVASSYRRHPYADTRPVAGAAEVPDAFLELLNEVRARAGAPPLLLAREQSRVAAEVAPYYFSAAFDADAQDVAELVGELVDLGVGELEPGQAGDVHDLVPGDAFGHGAKG